MTFYLSIVVVLSFPSSSLLGRDFISENRTNSLRDLKPTPGRFAGVRPAASGRPGRLFAIPMYSSETAGGNGSLEEDRRSERLGLPGLLGLRVRFGDDFDGRVELRGQERRRSLVDHLLGDLSVDL